MHRGILLAFAFAFAAIAAAQNAPVLRYDPPLNFSHSAIAPPDDYSSNEFSANLQIYPFRPITGNIEQMFQRTLLREWIDPRYRESNVAGQPEFRRGAVAGADLIVSARFAENVAGVPRQRLRMLIVSGCGAGLRPAFEKCS